MYEILTPSQAEALSDDKNRLKNHVLSIITNIEAGFPDELNSDGEEFSAFDYLQDALDIEYIVSSNKEYLGARVLVASGGPNIWINTRNRQVEGYWWGDKFIAQYNHTDGAIELDQACEDLMGC